MRVVAAPDKFRSSAAASEICAALCAELSPVGHLVVPRPMSDGGEGLLDALGGEERTTTVTGPLGTPVDAHWRVRTEPDGRTSAVIEMAQASGLELAGGRAGNDPVAATTYGTGELVVAAARAGVDRIVVGCGGSATTDGGRGAVAAIGGRAALRGTAIVVVCDVTTAFLDAARIFGPQKGADGVVLDELDKRLNDDARYYLGHLGVDVRGLERAGAAGGLAGGLAALGATLTSGCEFVAEAIDLDGAFVGADLLVTGEGALDKTSFSGKVVGTLLERATRPEHCLVVVGEVTEAPEPNELRGAALVSLSERYGRDRSLAEAAELVAQVTREHIRDHLGG